MSCCTRARLLVAELLLALGALPLTAMIAGSLFAVHPIGVEQLMIVTGRAELMALLFSLAALLLFIKQDRTSALLGGIAYGAALLAKESAIILPLWLAAAYYVRQEPLRATNA
jgi:hypothetical protein